MSDFEPITIEATPAGEGWSSGLTVRRGDRYINSLCKDEALWVVVNLLTTDENNARCYGGLKTQAEHALDAAQREYRKHELSKETP